MDVTYITLQTDWHLFVKKSLSSFVFDFKKLSVVHFTTDIRIIHTEHTKTNVHFRMSDYVYFCVKHHGWVAIYLNNFLKIVSMKQCKWMCALVCVYERRGFV